MGAVMRGSTAPRLVLGHVGAVMRGSTAARLVLGHVGPYGHEGLILPDPTYAKAAPRQRGMRPRLASEPASPSMVHVFPDPVCPYVKQHTLNPVTNLYGSQGARQAATQQAGR